MPQKQHSWQGLFLELADPQLPLPVDSVSWAMSEILEERSTEAQTAAFILGLKVRGESSEQVTALADVMMSHANLVPDSHGHAVVLDIVGTGGDGSHSVNISTMAAIVASACGIPVIKHGNRAVSSSTGAADVLEELGVVIDANPYQVAQIAREAGISFCFAPRHHPAMRFAAPARKQLGIPTVFNILGPLTNPARANAALIGAANATMAPIMAKVLLDRGVKALVVRGEEGLDEISLANSTRVWDVTSDVIQETELSPADFGVNNFDPELLRGGERERNAELTCKVLGGHEPGSDSGKVDAIRLSVAVNAAAALVAANAVTNPVSQASLAERINVYLPTTRQAIESGAAWEVLNRWVSLSRAIVNP